MSGSPVPYNQAFQTMWGLPPSMGGAANGSQWVNKTSELMMHAAAYGSSLALPATNASFTDVAEFYKKVFTVKWESYYFYVGSTYKVVPAGIAMISNMETEEGDSFVMPSCPTTP